MTEWEKIFEYNDDILEIASKLSTKMDPSLREDAIQYTYIILREKLDLSKATGPEREYVRGAIWNIVQRFFRDERKHQQVSLDELIQRGVQVSETKDMIWVGPTGEYSGGYRESDGD